MRLTLAQIVFLVKPLALLEEIHDVGLRSRVVDLPEWRQRWCTQRGRSFLSRRGAYRLLDGELAVFLALVEVIDVETRRPVVDPPEWS